MRGAGLHHRQALIEGILQVTGHNASFDGISTAGMLDTDLIVTMLQAAGASEIHIRRAHQEVIIACQNTYLSTCTSDLTPFLCAGVAETLCELQSRGAVLGLVTGNLSRIGRKKIELAGLSTYFSVGAFAEDGVTRAQLAQIAVSRAMEQGLVSTDSRISLIGDHRNDVFAAKQNGYQAVAVATGLTSLEELSAAGPDILVRNLTELRLDELF